LCPPSGFTVRRRAKVREPDAWHADKGHQRDAWVRACGRCEAAPECLSYALAAGERYGVYGGLTAGQRRALLRDAG
jgi:hypothetical protein